MVANMAATMGIIDNLKVNLSHLSAYWVIGKYLKRNCIFRAIANLACQLTIK